MGKGVGGVGGRVREIGGGTGGERGEGRGGKLEGEWERRGRVRPPMFTSR